MKQIFLLIGALLLSTTCIAQTRKQCIDDDWRYQYGALSTIPTADETASWRQLDLPHDWSVETDAAKAAGGNVVGPFSTNAIGTTQSGWMVGGEAWYEKTFCLDETQKDKLITLYFEGAYNYSTVYVNGFQVYFNPYGYSSFRFDITPYLKPIGETNRILVKVQNNGNNTRWYAGSGIYRHVWMLTTPKVHLDEWSTQISTQVTLDNQHCENAVVNLVTSVINESLQNHSGTLSAEVLDAQGKVVSATTANYNTLAKNEEEIKIALPLNQPRLWSPDTPYLYNIRIRMSEDGDQLTIPFGVRHLEFSAEKGFVLNGKPTLLYGGCIHHDNGLLGAAAWDKAEERKIKLVKNQGYNALRGSHNMQSEHFIHLCDSLGMMFVDECFDQWYLSKNNDDYHTYFPEYHTRDLQVMLKRDMNHPSIIMWGIGNEIPGRIEPAGMAVAEEMRNIIKSYDKERAVTAAICGWDAGDAWNAVGGNWDIQDSKAFESLDVGGYNYMYSKYEHDHGTHPNRIICGLESYPKEASQNWDLVEQKPYIIGDFVWTAMDYLGEAGIGSALFNATPPMFEPWPWYNGWCGDIDLIGQKKPQSYYRDVVWHRAPITMAVEQPYSKEGISAWGWQQEHQEWTWPEYDSQSKMNVNVYSRAPKVRLYLNDNLVGEGAPGNTYWIGFKVGYVPGTLRAVNVENDKETDSFELTTTGTPTGIRLTADRDNYIGNGKDLIYVTAELIDSDGRVCTRNSSEKVNFTVEGEGVLLAAGNASPTDMASFRTNTPKLFEGRALAIIRTNSKEGNIKINASSGKWQQSITISTHSDINTSIETVSQGNISADELLRSEQVYDLSGRAVSSPKRGLYIINGRKILL